MKHGKFAIDWIDFHRKPENKPNPMFPDGVDLDLRADKADECCLVGLKHPTDGCGLYMLRCLRCNTTTAITTAGRPDDPRSVKVPCKELTEASRAIN